MNSVNTLTQYDHLLNDDSDTAAIVIRERLRPVQGSRGVFFPPTFAGIGQGRKSDYHIDPIGPRADDPQGASRDGVIANRCTVDSVPSQGNRLENRLLRYSGKHIPKVTISGSRVGRPPIDLLEVGHRVADAVLRYTANDGFKDFEDALHSYVKGNADPLTRLAPTSLVFGHWDSRGETKSKARRIIRSEIVAYNVARVTKRSQYWSSIDPEVNGDLGQILKEAKDAASKDPEVKNPASQLGMTDVPAPESPGGVIAFGKIERTSMIALSGLRSLIAMSPIREPSGEANSKTETIPANASASSPATEEVRSTNSSTTNMRRYLLALALVCVVDAGVWDLREGCLLVRNTPPPDGDLKEGEYSITAKLVSFSGKEDSFTLPDLKAAEDYLDMATKAFFGDKIPPEKTLTFDPAGARSAIDLQRGGTDGQPKKKEEFIAALLVLPEYSGSEAELKKKKVSELKEMWRAKQPRSAETGGPKESEAQPNQTNA